MTPPDPPHPERHHTTEETSPSRPNTKPANASAHARFAAINQPANTGATINQTPLL
jgi:hypothetical protein